MICKKTDRQTYKSVINQPFTVFHSNEFNELNNKKCDDLLYLLFEDSKYRAGIIFGIEGRNLKSPFSAPYGGINFLKDARPKMIYRIIDSLKSQVGELGFNSIEITLPPMIYSQDHLSKELHAFIYNGFEIDVIDINNHIDLTNIDDPLTLYNRNARRNYDSSASQQMDFKLAKTYAEKKKGYEVIKKNRSEKGYPLKMSFNEVMSTLEIVPGDIFLCEFNGEVIAAALIYSVNKFVNQVIYWGHLENYERVYPMHYFIKSIIDYFSQQKANIKFLDVGPSSEEGNINNGLFYFKRSIGCKSSLKYSVIKKLDE